MDDLEEAISSCEMIDEVDNPVRVHDTVLDTTELIPRFEDSINRQDEYKIDEFILGLFEDGAYPGQVLQVSTDSLKASFMTPIFLKGKKQFHLWKWPSQLDEQEIEKSLCYQSVLPWIFRLNIVRGEMLFSN